jgi:hypothetical protein
MDLSFFEIWVFSVTSNMCSEFDNISTQKLTVKLLTSFVHSKYPKAPEPHG